MDVVTYALAQKYVKNAIGSLDAVTDVTVDGNSVVNADGVAEIVTPQILGEVADVKVDGQSVVDSEGVAQITLPDSANAISYDNSESGLDSTNIQDAVDEVLDKANKVDDIQTYGGNTLVTNKIADLSALTIKKSIPSTPTAIANFTDGAEMVMPSLTVGVDAWQEGSGDPSPTNVRPIHGWDSVNVNVDRKNFFNPNYSAWETSRNYLVMRNLPDNTLMRMTLVDKDTSVDISGMSLGFVYNLVTSATQFRWIVQNGEIQTNMSNRSLNDSDILCNNIMIHPKTEATFDTLNRRFHIQVELGVTATDYEPYNGLITNINLGDTRYGGRLEVVNGIAQFVATHGYVDLGTLIWNSNGNSVFWTSVTGCVNDTGIGNVPNALCDRYTVVVSRTNSGWQSTTDDKCFSLGYDSARMYVRDSAYNDATTFKNSLTNAQLVYELATPVIIPLGNYPISSLVGENNLFADSGEILEGEYIADASTVIAGLDARITALENA